MGCHRLAAYLNKELSLPGRALMRIHLGLCPICRKMMKQDLLNREIRSITDTPVPPRLRDRLMADAEAAHAQASPTLPQERTQSTVTRKRLAIALAATAALVAAVTGHLLYSSQDTGLQTPKLTNTMTQAQNPDGQHIPEIQPRSDYRSDSETAKAAGAVISRTDTRPSSTSNPAATVRSEATQPGTPVVVVVSARQPVRDGTGRTLDIGDRLSIGASVRTGAGGYVELVTRKGSAIRLDSNSELVFSSDGVATISRGRLYCSNRKSEIAQIITPAGEVRLLGTVVDAAVMRNDTVAVTVVEGAVQLSNAHGNARVEAGNRSVLVAYNAPDSGARVNTYKETSWYHGRWDFQSDYGDIAYTVKLGDGAITEVWTRRPDGSEIGRLRSYLGRVELVSWMPGERWLHIKQLGAESSLPDALNRGTVMSDLRPVVNHPHHLLDAATGECRLYKPLPEGHYSAWWYDSPSPDRTRTIFLRGAGLGTQKMDVFVQDWTTDTVTKIFTGRIRLTPAWAPDNQHVAICVSEGVTLNRTTSIVDTSTGQVKRALSGAGAKFSPDGRKLAYCSDFKGPGNQDIPHSGSIFVLDLNTPGAIPVRITPEANKREWAVAPEWAPDSKHILYYDSARCLRVIRDDGAEDRRIFQTPNNSTIRKASWAPSGKAVYATVEDLVSRTKRLWLIAIDGSSLMEVLNDDVQSSRLPDNVEAETAGAVSAVQEALHHCAIGRMHIFQGLLPQSREYFMAAAEVFEGIVWDYPLSGLAVEDTFRYADACVKMAGRTDDYLLAESCRMRQLDIRWALTHYVREQSSLKEQPETLQFPQDTAALKQWLQISRWNTDYLSPSDIVCCPGVGGNGPKPFIYAPPPPGELPEDRAVLVTCLLHPANERVWDFWSHRYFHESMIRKWKNGEAILSSSSSR